jgi:uncharacterized membrane protein YiaA
MNTNEGIKEIAKYMRRTRLNKICALALIGLGLISASISNDATFLIFTLLFGIPLFFSRRNWIS